MAHQEDTKQQGSRGTHINDQNASDHDDSDLDLDLGSDSSKSYSKSNPNQNQDHDHQSKKRRYPDDNDHDNDNHDDLIQDDQDEGESSVQEGYVNKLNSKPSSKPSSKTNKNEPHPQTPSTQAPKMMDLPLINYEEQLINLQTLFEVPGLFYLLYIFEQPLKLNNTGVVSTIDLLEDVVLLPNKSKLNQNITKLIYIRLLNVIMHKGEIKDLSQDISNTLAAAQGRKDKDPVAMYRHTQHQEQHEGHYQSRVDVHSSEWRELEEAHAKWLHAIHRYISAGPEVFESLLREYESFQKTSGMQQPPPSSHDLSPNAASENQVKTSHGNADADLEADVDIDEPILEEWEVLHKELIQISSQMTSSWYSYVCMPPSLRCKLMYMICEMVCTDENIFEEELRTMEPELLRVEPFGYDSKHQAYYVFGPEKRLYQQMDITEFMARKRKIEEARKKKEREARKTEQKRLELQRQLKRAQVESRWLPRVAAFRTTRASAALNAQESTDVYNKDGVVDHQSTRFEENDAHPKRSTRSNVFDASTNATLPEAKAKDECEENAFDEMEIEHTWKLVASDADQLAAFAATFKNSRSKYDKTLYSLLQERLIPQWTEMEKKETKERERRERNEWFLANHKKSSRVQALEERRKQEETEMQARREAEQIASQKAAQERREKKREYERLLQEREREWRVQQREHAAEEAELAAQAAVAAAEAAAAKKASRPPPKDRSASPPTPRPFSRGRSAKSSDGEPDNQNEMGNVEPLESTPSRKSSGQRRSESSRRRRSRRAPEDNSVSWVFSKHTPRTVASQDVEVSDTECPEYFNWDMNDDGLPTRVLDEFFFLDEATGAYLKLEDLDVEEGEPLPKMIGHGILIPAEDAQLPVFDIAQEIVEQGETPMDVEKDCGVPGAEPAAATTLGTHETVSKVDEKPDMKPDQEAFAQLPAEPISSEMVGAKLELSTDPVPDLDPEPKAEALALASEVKREALPAPEQTQAKVTEAEHGSAPENVEAKAEAKAIVETKPSPKTKKPGRSTLMPRRFRIRDIEEWCIDFSMEPVLYLKSKHSWYRLARPMKDYKWIFNTARRKFEISSRIYILSQEVPFSKLNYQYVVTMLRAPYMEMRGYKESDIMIDAAFIFDQMRNLDVPHLMETSLMRKLEEMVKKRGVKRKPKRPLHFPGEEKKPRKRKVEAVAQEMEEEEEEEDEEEEEELELELELDDVDDDDKDEDSDSKEDAGSENEGEDEREAQGFRVQPPMASMVEEETALPEIHQRKIIVKISGISHDENAETSNGVNSDTSMHNGDVKSRSDSDEDDDEEKKPEEEEGAEPNLKPALKSYASMDSNSAQELDDSSIIAAPSLAARPAQAIKFVNPYLDPEPHYFTNPYLNSNGNDDSNGSSEEIQDDAKASGDAGDEANGMEPSSN